MKIRNVFFLYCIFILSFSGCAKIDPRQVDLDIPSGIPEVKTTELSQTLRELGKMAEIYGEETGIMLDKIADNTGTSIHTKAEIPYDVTEITASALNSIGGNIAFIPYRPDIMTNLQNLGYQNFKDKLTPSVLVTGGITEFDRGLETQEASTNLGYDTTQFGQESPVGIEYTHGEKSSVAKITVDYNMIDISTMSGLAGIQTTNTIQVHKGIKEKELGFTLFGPTLGLKGEVKKVEGRHAALRILIQASMVQLVGKYLDLPYWRLLPGTSPDPTVESYVSRGWNYQMNKKTQIQKVQELLFLHGYNDVNITGEIDKETRKAVNSFSERMKCSKEINFYLYSALYYNIPLDEDALKRRYTLAQKAYEEKIKAQQQTTPN
jgi:hypothetical protein